MPGLVLRGRYQLDVLIATGGMGEVWRGTDLAIDRRVAIKVVRPEHADDQDGLARFRAEAHHAGSLSHPNIAQVFDYGEAAAPEPGYLVMELVDGLSLTRILDDGPLSPADVMDIVAQAARGLAAAHRAGLVHRDVKPGNLLVRQDGLVKITDFGIARAVGDTTVTQPGMLIGTPAYLAPERVYGAPASPATDLYSLGVVAYQCLTGHAPFSGEPLVVALAHLDQGMPALPPSVPPGVSALVAGLTRQDPAARPQSAWDVALRAEHLRVQLSSPEALSPPATAPPAAPRAGDTLLAAAALPASGPAASGGLPPPPAGSAPAAGSGPRPRGDGPRPPRRARRRPSLAARTALAATGAAAVGFIAWTLATLPGAALDQSPAVSPPAATRSASPSVLPRQSPAAATNVAGTGDGSADVAQVAATPQSSGPAGSPSVTPTPSSTGSPSSTATPSGSPTPTPTPGSPTPTPTPSTPTPSSPPPTTSVPSTPAPSTPSGTVIPSSAPSALVTFSPSPALPQGE